MNGDHLFFIQYKKKNYRHRLVVRHCRRIVATTVQNALRQRKCTCGGTLLVAAANFRTDDKVQQCTSHTLYTI